MTQESDQSHRLRPTIDPALQTKTPEEIDSLFDFYVGYMLASGRVKRPDRALIELAIIVSDAISTAEHRRQKLGYSKSTGI